MSALPFILGKELGKGSLCKVYEAILNSTGERVCVKKITIDNSSMDSSVVKREINTLKILDHPNCVRFIDSIFDNGKCYIIMELVEGGTLRSLIKEQKKVGTFEEHFLLKIFSQLASALLHCHDNMVIHRNVKLTNVLLTKDFDVKLCDFGFAKVVNEFDYLTASKVGTNFYVSPEMISESSYSFSTDIWSLGVLFYKMMTFKYPFIMDGNNQSTLFYHILNSNPAPIDGPYSDSLKEMIFRILNKDPRQRITLSDILSLCFMPKVPFDSYFTYMSAQELNNLGNEMFKQKYFSVAKQSFSLAARRGDAESAYRYGVIHSEKLIEDADPSEAYKYLFIAIERKCVKAMVYLGKKLRKGFLGAQPNLHESVRYLQMAIDTDPNNNDAVCEYGKALKKSNPAEATKHFLAIGDGEAYYQLGKLTQNTSQSYSFYQKAYELGSIKGTYALGCCLESGTGCSRNVEQAMTCYLIGVNDGHAPSMNSFGLGLQNGYLQCFPEEPIKFFQMSAEKGNPQGMNLYGKALEKSQQSNLPLAMKYYRMAAEHGNSMGKKNYENLVKKGIKEID